MMVKRNLCKKQRGGMARTDAHMQKHTEEAEQSTGQDYRLRGNKGTAYEQNQHGIQNRR